MHLHLRDVASESARWQLRRVPVGIRGWVRHRCEFIEIVEMSGLF